MKRDSRRSKGSILIISLGILVLLSVLAVSFSQLMRVERFGATQFRAKIQAKLLAEAGVEHAIASIQREFAKGDFAEFRKFSWKNSILVGLGESSSLSFANPAQQVDGTPFSGRVDRPEGLTAIHADGLQYQLRIVDTAELIYLGDLSISKTVEEGAVRVLNNIGRRLKNGHKEMVYEYVPTGGGSYELRRREREFKFEVLDEFLGKKLVSNGTKYRSWDEVREVLVKEYITSDDKKMNDDLRILQRLVTFHANPDPKTLTPSQAGFPLLAAGKRAPINVNRASRLVLTAALAGIKARYRYYEQSSPTAQGQWKTREIDIDEGKAEKIADEIVARRENRGSANWKDETHSTTNPFKSWQEFEGFVYTTVDNTFGNGKLEYADLILANASPNPRTAKVYNPDAYGRYRPVGPDYAIGYAPRRYPPNSAREHRVWENRIWLDKSDQLQYTLEFRLLPSPTFSIQSMGRVLASNGELLAAHWIETVTQVAQEIRLKTQDQFHKYFSSGLTDNATAGPESILMSEPFGQTPSTMAGGFQIDGAYTNGGQRFAIARPVGFETLVPSGPSEDSKAVWVYPDGEPTKDLSMLPNEGTKGWVHMGGNRVVDGYMARVYPDDRYVKYDSKHVKDIGGMSFWLKLDEETLTRDVGIWMSTNLVPGKPGFSVQRVAYMSKGKLTFSQTFCSMAAGVPTSVVKNTVRWGYEGQIRPDAFERLAREGAQWLQNERPGFSDSYYRSFGEHYARQVITAIQQGESRTVNTYIYDAERVDGLGHIGCITKTTDIRDKITTVFNPGAVEIDEVRKTTEAWPVEVDETAKTNYNFSNVMGATQNPEANRLLAEADQLKKEADQLLAKAADLQTKADKLRNDAEPLLSKAAELTKEADKLAAKADAKLAEAEEKKEELQELIDDGAPQSEINKVKNEIKKLEEEAADLKEDAAEKRSDAEKYRSDAQKLLDEAAQLQQQAQDFTKLAIQKQNEAAQKIKRASELAQQDAVQLKIDYERVIGLATQNPYRLSRVQVQTDLTHMRPGTWHHVFFAWPDVLNAVLSKKENGQTILNQMQNTEPMYPFVVRVDNQKPRASAPTMLWPPTTVWSSRQNVLANEFFPGPWVVGRASDEAGKDSSVGGKWPRFTGNMTFADYRVYEWPSTNVVPSQVSYRRFDPVDTKFGLEIDWKKLTEADISFPDSWTLSGTVHVEARIPMQIKPGLRDAEPMVGLNLKINDKQVKSGGGFPSGSGAIPGGILARDASGRYQLFKMEFEFLCRKGSAAELPQNPIIDPGLTSTAASQDDDTEATNGAHTVHVDAVVLRFPIVPATAYWSEIDRSQP